MKKRLLRCLLLVLTAGILACPVFAEEGSENAGAENRNAACSFADESAGKKLNGGEFTSYVKLDAENPLSVSWGADTRIATVTLS